MPRRIAASLDRWLREEQATTGLMGRETNRSDICSEKTNEGEVKKMVCKGTGIVETGVHFKFP